MTEYKEKVNTMENRAGGYISKLVFNDGSIIETSPNDIVIFVGPNNAGKSQSLKDIYALSKEKCPTTVVSDLEITKYSGKLSSLLETISSGENKGDHILYHIMGSTFYLYEYTEEDYSRNNYYDNYRSIFVANMDTAARLSICEPQPNIARDEPKVHPIHYAAFNSKYRKWLSDNFKKAFGKEVIPNTQFGGRIPLCIGEPVILTGDYEDEQARQEAYAEKIKDYNQVQNQGDGIKSFTGVLLYLMLNYYSTYLIDEPESFLHPPQARIMGQIIGNNLSDCQQAFIATHSEDIIKGLQETCPERLKIIRITREGDANKFSVLDNADFGEIWNDPLLKNSNIMSSLFHKSVVLCESDSDCQMYSIIENHNKERQGKYSEALFIHCGGKQRMERIITALRSLDVKVKLIVDLDVLDNETVFKGIIDAYGLRWDEIHRDYNIIFAQIQNSLSTKINRSTAKIKINQILDQSHDDNLSSSEIKSIKETVKVSSSWEKIKRMGVSAIPSGEASSAFKRINEVLQSVGIHLVTVGQLEGFVKAIGGHGPSWVNAVFETYPDLNDEIYDDINAFVEELNL